MKVFVHEKIKKDDWKISITPISAEQIDSFMQIALVIFYIDILQKMN